MIVREVTSYVGKATMRATRETYVDAGDARGLMFVRPGDTVQVDKGADTYAECLTCLLVRCAVLADEHGMELVSL